MLLYRASLVCKIRHVVVILVPAPQHGPGTGKAVRHDSLVIVYRVLVAIAPAVAYPYGRAQNWHHGWSVLKVFEIECVWPSMHLVT